MVISSDSPLDPGSGRVVDSEVLVERRARRAEAEGGLVAAQRERELLAGALERAERDLTATLQREFAEQRRHVELEGDAGGAPRALEVDVVRLRADLRAAEERATELARALTSERARAAAELALLEHELHRRSAGHRAVGAQIAELHRALQAVQLRVAALSDDASAAVTGAVAEIKLLRGALETLEVKQRRSAADSQATVVAAIRARADALEIELGLERERRANLEALTQTERARFAAELASTEVILRAAAERGHRTSEARVSELQRTVEGLRGQLGAAVSQLDRRVAAERGAREAVERELHAERDARTAEADARIADAAQLSARLAAAEVALAEADERAAVERARRAALETAAPQAPAAGDGDELVATRAGLRSAEAARDALEEELARERAERAAAEQRASAALEALTFELGGLRAADDANPIYDALRAGPRVPSADHPALWRPRAGEPVGEAEPPAVVVDLTRAAARLRAAGESGSALDGDVEEAGDAAASGVAEDARHGGAPQAAGAAKPATGGGVIPAVAPQAPTTQEWFAPALARLAGVDAATAERLLLAALAVQADRVEKEVAYAVVLPVTGCHHVRVGRHGDVRVVPAGARNDHDVDFCLEGSVEALSPLATGAAPRRLIGVTVRGRRRRLRRLLRALRAPVGLAELQGAGARPRPGDLLALLCLGVPAETVAGADFSVAYTVRGAGGTRTRTLVRAEPDGSLTAIPEAPDLLPADATVTVDAEELLGVLAGTAPVWPDGDAGAVAQLQGWLRGVQGPPG